jgi:MFS superfamily sulfate permease-like transporter
LCLLFLTGLLRNLPTVVLASIVLFAVKGLIDLPELKRLFRVSRFEFAISMVAFVGVLLLGILKGVLLAAVVSILMLLRRAARPHVAFLGRIPGTNRYSDLERNPDNERVPGAVLFRVEASVMYFNAENVRQEIWKEIRSLDEKPRLLLGDLSTSPYVDVAGARMLRELNDELAAAGIALRLAEARSGVRDILRTEGLEERVGYFGRRVSVDDVLESFFSTAEAGVHVKPP